MRRRSFRKTPPGSVPTGKRRVRLALVVALFALLSYYLGTRREYNAVTEETQQVSMSVDQEIALGLQAAPQMMQRHGGLHPNRQAQIELDQIGQRLVDRTQAGQTAYRFDFHLLTDERTVNAFALPGGQIFITAALASRLRTEGEIAGVLAHEIGHVVARHAAEHMAQARLTEGLADAAAIVAYDPAQPGSAQIATLIAQALTLKYGRNDELESDVLGVRFMAEAGYDPRALISVMEVLEATRESGRPPEFFSTHPPSNRRMAQIQAAIQEVFPNGVPERLIK
ncbi:MAG: M48 family metalloprotease [Rhodothermales bacterium]